MLRNCYENSLSIAKEHNLESIAFPLISAGAYGYPKEKALEVATTTINEYLQKNSIKVYMVLFDEI